MAQVTGAHGQYAVGAVRTSRVDSACQFVEGAGNSVAQKCVISFTASPEREDGSEYTCKDGLGEICWTVKNGDKEKRMNLDAEFCIRDLEMIELMTTATLALDAGGDAIGIERQGINAAANTGASFEAFAKVGYGQGTCPPVVVGETVPQWWRFTYGRTTWFLGDTTLEDGVQNISMTGYAEANPSFGNGPFDDYPATAGMGADTIESVLLDAAGPPVTQVGYIDTPVQA